MTAVPNWMVRWGITVFFGITTLLVLSWFFKYPDVVPASVTINATNAPANVVARTNGALKIFVQDNQQVEEGEIFALLKSSTRLEDFQELKKQLDTLPRHEQLN